MVLLLYSYHFFFLSVLAKLFQIDACNNKKTKSHTLEILITRKLYYYKHLNLHYKINWLRVYSAHKLILLLSLYKTSSCNIFRMHTTKRREEIRMLNLILLYRQCKHFLVAVHHNIFILYVVCHYCLIPGELISKIFSPISLRIFFFFVYFLLCYSA